ncbi:MAG: saccharopine dehydrogenase NADP-binding domain-containing protein [Paraglaciecola sp.]|uniref:saccharopine dehydrogenase family protein n=1 Tax=Paraglaciecola sp. TaxID=1920173 RepID=UPI00273D3390|nr:saccharopine dehydrogenase NADP-binding domain-containing protein [Paraglaciecola sp.]MDP5032753.1 saccharopine dehydrogenase NADP-binding domain-containing protein [Paraglaciecola sp.]MDP5130557.1 saccharopine dehydrogenase NADP-binding domain-containing protein [Paraglaciecola sp.]
MNKSKEFDLVVYGATGFTGRLVAEYLVKQYANDSSLKWAMAGRSEQKLAQVRDEIGAPSDIPLVVADAENKVSMEHMLDRTKVVLTTVGPYQLYGSDLVAMCASKGVDYVDLCGEPVWMREMIDAHGETAKSSGARIVFSCGFDSIPFDLGVFHLQELAKQQLGHTVSRVKGRVRKMRGTFSGGTAASLKATLAAAKQDPTKMQLLLNPFSLTPGFQGTEQPHGNKPYYDEDLGSWVTSFIMAAINTRNVHRSNHLLNYAYGEDFVYDEMLMTGPGEKGEAIANAVASDKSMSGDKGPKPGEGPSKEEREAGFYDALFVGIDTNGQQIKVSVSGELDPGYGSTSRMIAESAICLVKDATDTKGGIWTTAPAMGDKLIKRLVDNAGLSFKQE